MLTFKLHLNIADSKLCNSHVTKILVQAVTERHFNYFIVWGFL